ncbi:MAG TPA: signal recognition particle protein [Firmicutes bacterium]|nr:signal recognition particle protein [Bacillota bacterium]
MAFESLTDKMQRIFKKLKGQARITESNMDEMLREVRLALLEADVNFKVVKEFVNSVKEKAIGQNVLTKLSPGQMFVKIVRDELAELLGSGDTELKFNVGKPTIIMMVGLQGTGKTTTAAKLANLLKRKNAKKPLLVAGDIYRPAAIDQLEILAKQINVDIYSDRTGTTPPNIAKKGYELALQNKNDVVIIDTAGRLQIDEPLMKELQEIVNTVPVTEILLLVDAMSGQDAVNVATTFNEKLKITGLVMSKLDGDSRGGSALSIKHLTGIPIKFAGVGEKISDIEVFHPDRMADRIIGMGDVISLIEKAQENIDEEVAMKTTKRIANGLFDLTDMLNLMKQMRKMGPFGKILRMLPGMPKVSEDDTKKVEVELRRIENIINSMTVEERKHPSIIKNSRKVRIASGSGMTSADVNRLLDKYDQMKKQITQMSSTLKRNPGMMNQFKK